MREHFRFITILMLLLPFTGCLYIPPLGRQIGNEELKAIRIGSTTKAEVTNLLGKPDLLKHPQFYVYDSGKSYGYIISQGPIVSVSEQKYRILFEFTENEVVKRYNVEPIYREKVGSLSELPDNQTTSGKEVLFQKAGFRELILTGVGITCVAFSPNSKMVAARDIKGRLWLNDLDTGELYLLDKQKFNNFRYSPDGRSIAMIDEKGFVRILDTITWKELVVFRGHGESSSWSWSRDGARSLSFIPDSNKVAIGGYQKGHYSLKIWDYLTGSEIMTIDVPIKSIYRNLTSIAVSSDGKLLAGTTVNGVGIWDAIKGSY